LWEYSGLEDGSELATVVEVADIVLSILPLAEVLGLTRCIASCPVSARGRLFVDCNAVSPATTPDLGRVFGAAGFSCVDSGNIGPPPNRASTGTGGVLRNKGLDCH